MGLSPLHLAEIKSNYCIQVSVNLILQADFVKWS